MSNNPISVVATIKAKPGKESEVKEELIKLITPTRAETGCINYDLHESVEQPGVFVFYENWASQQALEEHLNTPHLKALKAKADALLVEPIDICLCKKVKE